MLRLLFSIGLMAGMHLAIGWAQPSMPLQHHTTPQPSASSPTQPDRRFRAMWWNVENLYDTLHDANCDDHEFLPTAPRRWNHYRYWRKQGHLAKIILAAGGLTPVDLVGLGEVENDSVIYDLCHRTRLARLGYEAIVSRSHDLRGIDLALLYQPENFYPIAHQQWEVPRDTLRERPTRPILHVAGRTVTGDTLDILLAHFPSRRGGVSATEPYRLRAAQLAVNLIDSLSHCRSHLQVLMMGDLNDEPRNASIRRILAQRLTPLSTHARPLPEKDNDDIEGTYFFQQRWSRIDHILVSDHLLRTSNPLHTAAHHCHIFAYPLLLEENQPHRHQPRHTYLGPHYHGGISDHLPLLLDLWY